VIRHFRSLEAIALPASWLTIGVFDGVHRGHQEIIRHLTAGAHQQNASAVVLTFHPHPEAVLGKKRDLKYLSLPDEKAALLDSLNVDAVVTLPFTRELAALSAETFMRRVQQRIHARRVLIGYDFALGRGREGDAVRLAEIRTSLGFVVQTFSPVLQNEEIVSSSHIRAYLASGRVREAADMLGRRYAIPGVVVHGDGRGGKIGIPTANLRISPEKAVPANGVYACEAIVEGTRFLAVTNIGTRPTFLPDSQSVCIEAHLLDFEGALYGKTLSLTFFARLRDEKTFSSVEDLLEQIRQDIAKTRELVTDS